MTVVSAAAKNKLDISMAVTMGSSYEVLQIQDCSFLDKTPINQILKKQSNQVVKELLQNQLKIL
jgi:hypothetical protein